MREKERFNMVVIYGSIVIALILTAFPLLMYICFQDGVREVFI